MDFLTHLGAVHWLVLGLLLLAAEALGASGFLIGAAVAALALSVLTWIVPDIGWVTQLVVYAISAAIATYVYYQVFRDAQQDSGDSMLNQRAEQLIGTRVTTSEAIDTSARIQIGDTMWKVKSEQTIEAGKRIEVIGADGMTLLVAEQID